MFTERFSEIFFRLLGYKNDRKFYFQVFSAHFIMMFNLRTFLKLAFYCTCELEGRRNERICAIYTKKIK